MTGALAQDPQGAAEAPEVLIAPDVPSAAAAPPAQASQLALPDVVPAAAAASPAEDRFPRYAALKPAVSFWTKVFAEFSENQSLVHSTEYPHKIFTILDFRGDAVSMDEFALGKRRSIEERDAKAQVEDLLVKLDRNRGNPKALSDDERRVYDLFADIDDDDKFKRMRGTIRAQRGLRERTESALETSNRYLPEMERIFGGYQLPLSLTRLPLVESSFNVDAYSKVGAAGLWQFIPASARIYMRLNEVVDDRRDPWTSTDGAARHLRDDYAALQDWPLAITAYNHGRAGLARGLKATGGSTLVDLIDRYEAKSFGFASKNFYAEFLAAVDVERAYRKRLAAQKRSTSPLEFDVVETRHYVPYDTLRKLCGADDAEFRRLNPAYRPEVIAGKLYVPPGHLIRVPAGSARSFEVAYSSLGDHERFDAQRVYYLLHKVKRGELLGRIAKSYGVTQAAIVAANGLKSKGVKLRVGQVLRIPPHTERRPGPVTVAIGESKPQQTRAQKDAEKAAAKKEQQVAQREMRVHRVRSGQTLGGIAKRYKVTIADLREANGLGTSSTIRVGMKLKVPLDS